MPAELSPPRSVTGPDGQAWTVAVLGGSDDGDVYLSHGSWGQNMYLLRRAAYLLGRRSDVRLVVTRDADRAKRRLLDQPYPDAQAAWNAGSQLVDEITAGRWPVRAAR